MQGFFDLFSHVCIIFGKNFTLHKIKPIFQRGMHNLEEVLPSFNQYCPSLNVVPVYLVSVLSYCDRDSELERTLKRFLYALPLCGITQSCLEVTVTGLCRRGLDELVVTCLWDAVVHQRPLIRAASAGLFLAVLKMCGENLLCTKVAPALVTLANDSDVLVRTATVPVLGSLIIDTTFEEVQDKAYMQLESLLSDGNILDNHTLLRQLIVTMGNVVSMCRESFKYKVIVPKLYSLTNYTYQMTSQTRKIDMTVALIEAFSQLLFCTALNSNSIMSFVLPGLKYLEAIVRETPSLASQIDGVVSIIKETESKLEMSSVSPEKMMRTTQNIDDVRQKVSKIFSNPVVNKSNTLPNFQGIFKKK